MVRSAGLADLSMLHPSPGVHAGSRSRFQVSTHTGVGRMSEVEVMFDE